MSWRKVVWIEEKMDDLDKPLIIADENAISEGDWRIREKKRGLDLKPIHIEGWPKHSTFRNLLARSNQRQKI